MRTVWWLMLASLAACTGAQPEPEPSGSPDDDGDDFPAAVDCDDANGEIFPGAVELCDGTDNDCDGSVDEDPEDGQDYFADEDGDGYGDAGQSTTACEAPEGQVEVAGDCNDEDATIHPTAEEDCGDSVDRNCDGSVAFADADGDGTIACEDCNDSDPALHENTVWWSDADGDGFGDPSATATGCIAPTEHVAPGVPDCNDGEPSVNPDATEVCDELHVDEDCSGAEGDLDPNTDSASKSSYYADVDGDGFGDGSDAVLACAPPEDRVEMADDCDDLNAEVNPAAEERCDIDGVDEDCDGVSEDDDASVTELRQWYADQDGDGFGDATSDLACASSEPTDVLVDGDCDDDRPDVHPDAEELCDADNRDEDCDGLADNADASASVPTKTLFFTDRDGDGFGDPLGSTAACDAGVEQVSIGTDCDDLRADIHPDAAEICDAEQTDEDCNGTADDADPGVAGKVQWYADGDEDGYGGAPSVIACASADAVTSHGDCNDAEAAIHPGAAEVCDAADRDEDCDGASDDDDPSVLASGTTLWYLDADGDDQGAGLAISACDPPPNAVATTGDCDDQDDEVFGGGTDTCDGKDNDCSGGVDDDPQQWTSFFVDADWDGFGDPLWPADGCEGGWLGGEPQTGLKLSPLGEDCDDAMASVYPGAPEMCDGAVNDCDSTDVFPDEDGLVSLWTRDPVLGETTWTDVTSLFQGSLSGAGIWADTVDEAATLQMCTGTHYVRLEDLDQLTVVGVGSGVVLDGVSEGPVVAVQGTDVVLDGLLLQHGAGVSLSDSTAAGAAIVASDGADLTLRNLGVSDHPDTAIYAADADLTLSNVRFTDNVGQRGGALRLSGGTLHGGDLAFTGNTATEIGGALFAEADAWISLTDSTFEQNETSGKGGAVYVDGVSLSAAGLTFDQNSADVDGGALYAVGSELHFPVLSSFTDNLAVQAGGALFFGTDVAVTGAGGALAEGNLATHGGGLAASGTSLTLNAWEFVDNEATQDGGALYVEGGVLDGVSESSFNQAQRGGAIALLDGATLAGNPSVHDNTATLYGGGVYAGEDTLVTAYIYATDNLAQYGGGAYLEAATLVGSGGYDSNVATADGGAVYLAGSVWSSASASLTLNQAARGGGLFVDTGSSADLYVQTHNNHASVSGGGIFNEGTLYLTGESYQNDLAPVPRTTRLGSRPGGHYGHNDATKVHSRI